MGLIFWIVISIIILLFLIGAVIFYFVNEYLNVNYKMALYADMGMSMKNESIFLNFTNANKHIDFWNAHEADLKLYAMGTPIEAVFYRSPDVPTGYKIAYATSLSNMEVLSLIGAVKYNKFEVSYDCGTTRVKVNSIKDSVAKKITVKMQKMKSHSIDDLKEEIINNINESDKKFYLESYNVENNRIISHINESKTTQTSLRFQAIIQPKNPIFEHGFNPEEGTERFYYTYNGNTYEFKSVYLGKVENMFQWDFLDLDPATIYCGLCFSVDGGKTIVPSTSLYGITKEPKEDGGAIPSVSEANLSIPKENEIPLKMWDEEVALKYLGENLLRKTCDIIVKKHHENKYPDDFISLHNVEPFYSEFSWIEFGLKYKNKNE